MFRQVSSLKGEPQTCQESALIQVITQKGSKAHVNAGHIVGSAQVFSDHLNNRTAQATYIFGGEGRWEALQGKHAGRTPSLIGTMKHYTDYFYTTFLSF